MKVHNAVGRDSLVGDVGIEIEVEGAGLPDKKFRFWKTTVDGSLRGESLEYVTKGPVQRENVFAALNELNIEFAKKQSVLNFSFRTSVHTHINVLDMEVEELLTLIYIYYLFEEALITYAGPERKGNRFCLRLRDSEALIDLIVNLFKNNGHMLKVKSAQNEAENYGEQVRYGSLNLASILKFGSLEIRALRGTSDPQIIIPWVETLLNMREFAIKFGSPLKVKQYIVKFGVEKLFKSMFKEHAAAFTYCNLVQDVLYNMSLSIQIPYELKFIPEKQIEKQKEEIDVLLDALAENARIFEREL